MERLPPSFAGGIATTVLGRGIGVLVPLLLIPVTLTYLGVDFYGLWMAAAALTGMAAFADLGLGNGLMTRLAPCHSTGDTALARRYVSTAYLTLGTVAAGGCALLWLAAAAVPWSSIFNGTGSGTEADARAVALVCLTAFLVNLPLSLVNRVQYACRQVLRSNLWQAAGNLSALLLALGAVRAGLPPVAVVAATVAGPVLANAANTGWFYGRRMPELRPSPWLVDRAAAGQLLRLGGQFFVLAIVMSLAISADNLIIAHTLGLPSVTEYAVPARIFAQVGLLMSMVTLPLWPANADALARGDLTWVRRSTRRFTVGAILVVLVPCAILVPAGDTLLGAWLGGSVPVDRWLLAGFALWWLLLAAVSPRFMAQNAAGVVRPQLLGWSGYLLLSLPAKWYGAEQFGLAAIPSAGVAVYLVTVLPAAISGYRRALRQPPATAPQGPAEPRPTQAGPAEPRPAPAGPAEHCPAPAGSAAGAEPDRLVPT